jgi:hypothetical protein
LDRLDSQLSSPPQLTRTPIPYSHRRIAHPRLATFHLCEADGPYAPPLFTSLVIFCGMPRLPRVLCRSSLRGITNVTALIILLTHHRWIYSIHIIVASVIAPCQMCHLHTCPFRGCGSVMGNLAYNRFIGPPGSASLGHLLAWSNHYVFGALESRLVILNSLVQGQNSPFFLIARWELSAIMLYNDENRSSCSRPKLACIDIKVA